MNIVVNALLVGFFEVIGLDYDMLVHWELVLPLDNELGHWIFSCWMIPTPQAPSTAAERAWGDRAVRR